MINTLNRQQMASSLTAEAARNKRDPTCCITSELLPTMPSAHQRELLSSGGKAGFQPHKGLLSKPEEESFAVVSEVNKILINHLFRGEQDIDQSSFQR